VQTEDLATSTVQTIPLNGRDFTQLLTVTPGYAGYGVGFLSAINGAQATQTNWQIEGADNNDAWINTSAVNQGGVYGIPGVLLPVDSVDEFSLVTQGNAETGRNPGGTVNLVLKSGTNRVHGSAYYYNATRRWRHRRCSRQTGRIPRRKTNCATAVWLHGRRSDLQR